MLRDGLRAYHALGDLKGAGRYNWNDVMEAIDEQTGVVIPAETLRQFAERFRDPRRGGMRSLQSDRLAAVYEFLTHEDVRIFTPDEFDDAGFDPHFVLQFRNTLRRRYDKASGEYFERLDPYWRSVRRNGPYNYVLTALQFEEIGQNQGTFYVTEREEDFHASLIDHIMKGAHDNLPDAVLCGRLADDSNGKRISQGYAVISPEGTLFIFLKDRSSSGNRYYVSLFRGQAEPASGEDRLAGILHKFDYEAELPLVERAQDPAYVAEHVLQHVRGGTLLFCPSGDRLFRRFSARFITPDTLPAIGGQLVEAPPPAPDVAVATQPDILGEAQDRLAETVAAWRAKLGRALVLVNGLIKAAFTKRHVESPPVSASASGEPKSVITSMTEEETQAVPVAAHNPVMAAPLREPYPNVVEEIFRPFQDRFVAAIPAWDYGAMVAAIGATRGRSIVLDFNARHPDTGQTALHSMAAAGSRKGLKLLFSEAAYHDVPLNHLLRDNKGRLPSKMASLYGEDPVMARYLLAREKQAARKLGLELHWVEPDPEGWNRRVHIPPRYMHHQ